VPMGKTRPEPTPQQILGVLDRHPDIRECLASAQELVRYHVPGPPSIYAALRYLFGLVDEKDAADFFGKLALGTDLGALNPLYALRRLLVLASTNPAEHKPRPWFAAVTIKTWNAYRRGDEVKAVVWRSGGANPEAFPRIDGITADDLR
jgi:hypothetical protein